MTEPDSPIFVIYYNLGLGGLQKKIVDIINFLAVKKPDLRIFLLLRRKKEEFDISWRINNSKVRVFYYNDWMKVKIPFFFPIFVLIKVIVFKPTVIYSFSDVPSLSAIWAKLLLFRRKIKVIVSERAYTSWHISSQRFGSLRNFLVRIFYPLANNIVCLTKATKTDLIGFYGFNPSKIAIIPNWTSLAKERIPRVKKEYDLIYLGRLAKAKNIFFLLESLKLIRGRKKDIKLCLVGDGEEKGRIQEYIGKNNLSKNVVMVGVQYDVRPYLVKSKILVLTAQYKTEGFPTAVLEGMAMGVPVLCRRFSGAEDVIRNGNNGFLVETAERFCDKALELLSNDEERKKIATKAKSFVTKYHSLENINHYLNLANL